MKKLTEKQCREVLASILARKLCLNPKNVERWLKKTGYTLQDCMAFAGKSRSGLVNLSDCILNNWGFERSLWRGLPKIVKENA